MPKQLKDWYGPVLEASVAMHTIQRVVRKHNKTNMSGFGPLQALMQDAKGQKKTMGDSVPSGGIGSIPDYVLLFVVVISAAYVGELLPKSIQFQLNHKIWAKHLVAMALLALTIVWSQDDTRPSVILGNTVVVYAWFLIMFEMTEAEFLVVIALLLATFSVGKARKRAADTAKKDDSTSKDEHTLRSLDFWEKTFLVGATLATVVFGGKRFLDRAMSWGTHPWQGHTLRERPSSFGFGGAGYGPQPFPAELST